MPETKNIDTTYHSLTLSEVRPLTADSVMLTFNVPPHLEALYRFEPGQYLTLRTNIEGKRVSRCYSICSPIDSGDISVAIRQVEGGQFSSHAVNHFEADEEIEVMPPMGHFKLSSRRDGETVLISKLYVGIAGGSGITPIMSMITTVMKSEPSSRFVLFYANRSEQSMMFRDELTSMLAAFSGRFFCVPFFSEGAESEQLIHHAVASTLNNNTSSIASTDRPGIPVQIKTLLRELPDLSRADSWYLCGPQGMTDTLQQVLIDNAVSAGCIQRELFTADNQKSTTNKLDKNTQSEAGSQIKVIFEGESIEFHLSPKDDFVLNEALKIRDDLPHACQFGGCGTCKAKVVEGSATMKDNMALEDEEVEEGYILTCQATPTSPVLAISFDE